MATAVSELGRRSFKTGRTDRQDNERTTNGDGWNREEAPRSLDPLDRRISYDSAVVAAGRRVAFLP